MAVPSGVGADHRAVGLEYKRHIRGRQVAQLHKGNLAVVGRQHRAFSHAVHSRRSCLDYRA